VICKGMDNSHHANGVDLSQDLWILLWEGDNAIIIVESCQSVP